MSNVSSFMRCVGESPALYGARRAYSCVPPSYDGPCSLHYELGGLQHATTFTRYQQALTAATMAIFCETHDYQHVIIRADARSSVPLYPNAVSWRQAQR